jgi:PKD repeat protein
MWSSASGPAPVSFSPNGTNVAKASTATFTKPGSYTLQVLVTNAAGLTAMGSVMVEVDATQAVVVQPATATVLASRTQTFSAALEDQFGDVSAAQPAFSWSVTGGGSISGAGVFTAGSTAGGPFTVHATAGSVSGTASVNVSEAPPAKGGGCGSTGAPELFSFGSLLLVIARLPRRRTRS